MDDLDVPPPAGPPSALEELLEHIERAAGNASDARVYDAQSWDLDAPATQQIFRRHFNAAWTLEAIQTHRRVVEDFRAGLAAWEELSGRAGAGQLSDGERYELAAAHHKVCALGVVVALIEPLYRRYPGQLPGDALPGDAGMSLSRFGALMAASSLGTPEAVAWRETGRQEVLDRLTGMEPEQADWDEQPLGGEL